MRTTMLCLTLAAGLLLTACGDAGADDGDLKEKNLELQAEVRRLNADLEEAREQMTTLRESLEDRIEEQRKLAEEARTMEKGLLEDLREARDKLETTRKRTGELEARMRELEMAETEEAGGADPEPEGENEGEEDTETETAEDARATMESAARRLAVLGAGLLAEEQFQHARAALLIARQLGADVPVVYFHLGSASSRLDQWEAALSNYREVVDALGESELTEDQSRMLRASLLNAGVAMENLEKYAEAAEYYVRALEHDPQYAPAYYNLGVLYARHLDDREQAVAMLRKHVTLKGRRSASALDIIQDLQNGEE